MIVRKAKLKEVPAIVELWKEFMRDHDKIFLSKYPQHKKYLRRRKDAPKVMGEFIRKNIHSKNATVVVAEEKGKLVGYGMIMMKKDPPVYVENTNAYITDLFVKRQHRGKKISSEIKDALLQWAQEKGEHIISLNAFVVNTHARNVYKKWGLKEFSVNLRKIL